MEYTNCVSPRSTSLSGFKESKPNNPVVHYRLKNISLDPTHFPKQLQDKNLMLFDKSCGHYLCGDARIYKNMYFWNHISLFKSLNPVKYVKDPSYRRTDSFLFFHPRTMGYSYHRFEKRSILKGKRQPFVPSVGAMQESLVIDSIQRIFFIFIFLNRRFKGLGS